ncbi:MAG: acyl-CoA/acyl-ACP dehydrogenase [Acidobacteriota bacterium]|nr:acyl-CoA/acyl-ACP dehydrogenase [Acidobacteriota bacterium]
MNLLSKERGTLVELLPSLDTILSDIPLDVMEKPGNPSIAAFRDIGGCGLLIPRECGGLGATPLQALQVQCAIASRAPSLAVATTMHHFSVATVVEVVRRELGSGFEWLMLEAIAKQNLYVASGFAEGRSGASILASDMRVERTPDGLIICGSKKPCSLSQSMKLLTASLIVPSTAGDEPQLAVALIPSETPGIERRRFWNSSILAGAESDELVLDNVSVPAALVSYFGVVGEFNNIQDRGFVWFELLIAASYLGIAASLVERVILARKGSDSERALLAIEIQGALSALEGVASAMTGDGTAEGELAHALLVRYAVQRAIERSTSLAAELLGGMAYVSSSEVSYLYAAARCLAFHPPSRHSASRGINKYLAGEPFIIS